MGYVAGMELLLAEQLLLLALDDLKGSSGVTWGGDSGLAAALLLDLGRQDLLRVDDEQRLQPVDGPAPEHPVLAQAQRAVLASDSRRDARTWVIRLQRDLGPLQTRVARGLVERGVLSEERVRMLGIFPSTRYPTADLEPERRLRRDLTQVLVDGRRPTEQEALLVGLLHPLGLVDDVVPGNDRLAARRRAQQIGAQGLTGNAVREAVAGLQAAVVIGAVIVPISTGSS